VPSGVTRRSSRAGSLLSRQPEAKPVPRGYGVRHRPTREHRPRQAVLTGHLDRAVCVGGDTEVVTALEE